MDSIVLPSILLILCIIALIVVNRYNCVTLNRLAEDMEITDRLESLQGLIMSYDQFLETRKPENFPPKTMRGNMWNLCYNYIKNWV